MDVQVLHFEAGGRSPEPVRGLRTHEEILDTFVCLSVACVCSLFRHVTTRRLDLWEPARPRAK